MIKATIYVDAVNLSVRFLGQGSVISVLTHIRPLYAVACYLALASPLCG